MKTLYLHIGTMKTASTVIQLMCAKNRDILEKYNFSYPDIAPLDDLRSHNINGLFVDDKIWDDKKERDFDAEMVRFDACMEEVKKEFEKFDNVIISNETIWSSWTYRVFGEVPRMDRMQEWVEKEGWKLKIIVYFRRQDQFVESWWNQIVKRGYHDFAQLDWDQYLELYWSDPLVRTRSNYYNVLKLMADMFGKETIVIRPFDKNQFANRSIQADFMQILGLEYTEEYKEPTSAVNPRINGNCTKLQILTNGIAANMPEKLFLQEASHASTERSKTPRNESMFSKEEAQAFMEKYAEDNEKIEQEFYNGEQLFSRQFKDVVKWEEANEWFEEDMIRYLTSLNLQMFRKVTKLEKEVKQLKKDNKELRKDQKDLKRQFKDHLQKMKHPVKWLKNKTVGDHE